MNKQELLNKLQEYNLDNDKFIIIGSAALVLKGIKEKCHDIDIALNKDYNNYLLKQYHCKYEKEIDGHKIYLIDDILNFSTHYYGCFKGEKIENYLIQTPNEVLKLKQTLNRKKDEEDIKLILNYLENLNINSLVFICFF